jgi:spoIIIJ-associated protein
VEWVETVGKSVEEAKDRALDLLGVDERDAEFDVLEEPKVGFLGRVKGTARVRARVRPAAPRAKVERRGERKRRDGERSPRGGRGRKPASVNGGSPAATATADADASASEDDEVETGDTGDTGGAATRTAPRRRRKRGGRGRAGGAAPAAADQSDDDEREPGAETDQLPTEPKQQKVANMPELSLDDQAQIVASFLDGLVEAFGLTATTSWEHGDEDNTEVRVVGDNLGLLVGPKGRTLQAVTEVARSVVVRHGEGGSTGRVHVDVAGYRQRRREALARFTTEVADEVRSSGTAKALEAMSAADRKVVHDTVASLDGVSSTSEGEEPYRRVVILPA